MLVELDMPVFNGLTLALDDAPAVFQRLDRHQFTFVGDAVSGTEPEIAGGQIVGEGSGGDA
jgi:hypothetical protein